MNKYLFLGFFFFLSLYSFDSWAKRIYVDSTNTGFQDGTSWSTAYASFTIAVNNAVATDTVWVAKGTYQPSLNNSFTLKENVKFFGGFKNTDTAFSQRDIARNPSILKGNGRSVLITWQSQNITNATILDGFSVVDGTSNLGSGYRMEGNSPIIRNCTFRNNVTNIYGSGFVRGGGAVSVTDYRSHPIFENCTFDSNKSGTLNGGAIKIVDGRITINNCVFSNNIVNNEFEANAFSMTSGGAIYGIEAIINITNSSFINNRSTYFSSTNGAPRGGAIGLEESILNVSGSYFYNNVANSHPSIGSSSGGAIDGFSDCELNISNSHFENNSATTFLPSLRNGGGAIYNSTGLEHFSNTIFSGNNTSTTGLGGQILLSKSISYTLDTAVIDGCTFTNGSAAIGGSIYVNGDKLNIVKIDNSTFNSNSARVGGAIFTKVSMLLSNNLFYNNTADSAGGAIYNNGHLKLVNATIANNNANIVGSAIYNVNANSDISNSIIWGNKNMAISNDGGAFTAASYSLIQGFNANATNHILAGTTNPLFIDTALNDFRLLSSSPCINAGNIDSIPSGILTDIVGNPRVYGGAIDLGAYEFFFSIPIVRLGNDTAICIGDSIRLDAGNEGSTYLWNTNQTSRSIEVSTPGTYYVTVSNIEGTSADTIIISTNSLPVIALGNDTNFCVGNSLLLDARNTGATYSWNTNQTSQTLRVDTSGLYIVNVIDVNGCANSDSIGIVVNPLPIVHLGNDTSICTGQTLQLNAQNSGSSFIWNTGDTTSSIIVDTAGMYAVTVTNMNNCSNSDTLLLSINSLPIVDLGVDTTICEGTTLTLNAGNQGALFLWNTGANTQSITIDTAGLYSVVVTNSNHCSQRDTLSLSVNPKPILNLGNDTSFCDNSVLLLNAGSAGDTIIWNTGARTQSIAVDTSGIYSVTIIAANGCSNTDSIAVTVDEAPIVNLGNDTTVFLGNTITLNAGSSGASYLWNTGAHTRSINVSQTGTYSVSVLSAINFCYGTDTIVVTFIEDNTSIGNPTKAEAQIKVFPNPAQDYIQIQLNLELLKNKEIVIVDVSGRIVKSLLVDKEMIVIDISELTSGNYIINVANGASVKFVKK